jgi:hypothetical protein
MDESLSAGDGRKRIGTRNATNHKLNFVQLSRLVEKPNLAVRRAPDTNVRSHQRFQGGRELSRDHASWFLPSRARRVKMWGIQYSRIIDGRRVALEIFPYRDRSPDDSERAAVASARQFIPYPVSVVGQCSALFEGTIYRMPDGSSLEIPLFVLVDFHGTWYLHDDEVVHFLACSVDDALSSIILYPRRSLEFLPPNID